MSMKQYRGELQGGRGDGNRNLGAEPKKAAPKRRNKILRLNGEESALIKTASLLTRLVLRLQQYPLSDQLELNSEKAYRYLPDGYTTLDGTVVQSFIDALEKAHISSETKACTISPRVYLKNAYNKNKKDHPSVELGCYYPGGSSVGKVFIFDVKQVEEFLQSSALEAILEKARQALKNTGFVDSLDTPIVDRDTSYVLNNRPLVLRCLTRNAEDQGILKERDALLQEQKPTDRSGRQDNPRIAQHTDGPLGA